MRSVSAVLYISMCAWIISLIEITGVISIFHLRVWSWDQFLYILPPGHFITSFFPLLCWWHTAIPSCYFHWLWCAEFFKCLKNWMVNDFLKLNSDRTEVITGSTTWLQIFKVSLLSLLQRNFIFLYSNLGFGSTPQNLFNHVLIISGFVSKIRSIKIFKDGVLQQSFHFTSTRQLQKF